MKQLIQELEQKNKRQLELLRELEQCRVLQSFGFDLTNGYRLGFDARLLSIENGRHFRRYPHLWKGKEFYVSGVRTCKSKVWNYIVTDKGGKQTLPKILERIID